MSSSYTVEAVLKATGASQFQAAFANAEQAVGKFKEAGKGMANAGKKLTAGLTVPIVGAGAASIKMASDFESGMSEVAALSGATGSDLEMLEAKAREMGASTKYSATEASEGLQYMALAGWDAEQMAAGLEPSLLLAGAAGMELGNATDIVTDTMSMFQMEASEATKMTDMLAYAQANSNTDVNMLGEALVNVGANANAMGYDLADTSAILGTFADQGLKGGRAGTALSAIFRDMKKNAEDGAIAIGDTNVAIQDAEGNYRDMVDIIADIEKATDGMSDAQRDAALSTTFGDQAISGMNMALAAGSKEIAEFEDGIRSSDGAAKDMYDTMQDNLKGSFEELKSAISEAAITIGDALIPVISDLVGWINDWVDRFNALDESTQENIVKVGLMVAALGPLLVIGGKIMTGIGLILPLIGALNAPIVAIVAVIGAVTVAIVKLYNENEEFRTAVVAIWESIKKSAGAVWDSVKNVIVTTVEIISKVVSTVFEAMKDFIDNNQEGILLIVETVWGLISSFIENTLGVIEGVVNTVMGIITGDWERAWEGIKTIVESVWKHMQNLIDIAINVVRAVVESVMGAIKGVFDNVWGAIKAVTEATWGAIRNVIEVVTSGVQSTITTVWGAIQTVTTTVFGAIKSIATSVWDGVKDAMTMPMEAAKTIIGGIVDTIKGFFDINLYDSGKAMINSVWDGVNAAKDAVISKISGVAESVRNLWPFSPAKEGPLKDIHKMDFAGPISKSIDNARKPVMRSMTNLAGLASGELSLNTGVNMHGGKGTNAVGGGNITQNITVVSPDPTSPADNARKIKQASRELARGW